MSLTRSARLRSAIGSRAVIVRSSGYAMVALARRVELSTHAMRSHQYSRRSPTNAVGMKNTAGSPTSRNKGNAMSWHER